MDRKRLEELERDAPKIEPVADLGIGVEVTEAHVDAEMYRRGLARPIGGFGSEMLYAPRRLPTGTDWRDTVIRDVGYQTQRQKVRAELETFEIERVNKSKGNRAVSVRVTEAVAYALTMTDRMSNSSAANIAAKKFDVSPETIRKKLGTS